MIDIVPTHYLYTHVNIDFVQAYFHWFNYLRAAPAPENELLAQRAAQAGRELIAARKPSISARTARPKACTACARTIAPARRSTLQHDAADLGEKIRCPLHVLWAENGAMDRLYDVLAIWRERARTVTGKGMPGGHNMQEGAPAEVLAELRTYLRA